MDDRTPPKPTRPPSTESVFLLEEFKKEVVKQSDRMDDLAKELFKLELAIPGIYATVLKLFVDRNTQLSGHLVLGAFLCWAAALGLTLWGLSPKKREVLKDAVERGRIGSDTGKMTIREYYTQIAEGKLLCLRVASVIFFIGIVFAALSIFR